MHARFPMNGLLRFVVSHCERALAVLVVILAHAGSAGAWPAVSTISRLSGKSEAAVHRALRALVRLGILISCRRHRPCGADTSTLYRLSPCWGSQLRQGEGVSSETPLIFEQPSRTTPLPPAALPAMTEAGGDTPPAPPPLPVPAGEAPGVQLQPEERQAAVQGVLDANLHGYPAAHGGRPYLPRRMDSRAAPRLVAYAEAYGCRSRSAVSAWVVAYLARFWRLGGRWAERDHRLSDAPKVSSECRPPVLVPRPVVPAWRPPPVAEPLSWESIRGQLFRLAAGG